MRIIEKLLNSTLVFTFLFVFAACFAACDDENDSKDNDKNNETTDTDSNDENNDSTDNNNNSEGEAQLVGSCVLEGMFCMSFECIGKTVCEGMDAGSSAGCDMSGGVWSTEDCNKTDSIGWCREDDESGDVVIYYYEDGMLDADMAEETCEESGDTFTRP